MLAVTERSNFVYTYVMELAFDPMKRKANIAKHGVDFLVAARVFLDPFRLDAPDDRVDYKEERRLCLGLVEGRAYVVIYVVRQATRRIISARKANEREQRKYREVQA